MATRQTNQKEIIVDTLEVMNHPTAEELLAKIAKKYGDFSKATLYRNLAQFVEDGKVQKVSVDGQTIRYEIAKGFHYHVVCESCGKISNLILPKPLTLPSSLLGYDITSHELTFFGLCEKCKQK